MAVRRNSDLRKVGQRIRRILEEEMREEEINGLCENFTKGVSKKWMLKVRSRLAEEFDTKVTEDGLQAELWKKVLFDAKDPDAEVLPEWMCTGFPLGIEGEIENTGIFPATEMDSDAIEASRLEGVFVEDFGGEVTNYSSFAEAGAPAEELLQHMVDTGRSEVVHSWDEVVEKVGLGAKLTKMACIVKMKENGEMKYRLVVDCRRSGINGLSHVRERVILPKITDVVSSIHNLMNRGTPGGEEQELELFSADFKDAFHMLPLK